MAYIAICDDIDNSQTLRSEILADHLQYVEQHQEQIAVAGPLGEGDYRASVFVYNVSTAAEAESLLHHDPYYRAGLYQTVRLEVFKPAIGTWVGGVQW